jgi:hypothetical protein
MTLSTHPAFAAALESLDLAALTRLYESALEQRDRAEAQIRCLLVTIPAKGDWRPTPTTLDPVPLDKLPKVGRPRRTPTPPNNAIDHSISLEDLL